MVTKALTVITREQASQSNDPKAELFIAVTTGNYEVIDILVGKIDDLVVLTAAEVAVRMLMQSKLDTQVAAYMGTKILERITNLELEPNRASIPAQSIIKDFHS